MKFTSLMLKSSTTSNRGCQNLSHFYVFAEWCCCCALAICPRFNGVLPVKVICLLITLWQYYMENLRLQAIEKKEVILYDIKV
ncbi:hypothetical protein MBAV_002122 [Candidatus Magnetobacterium bavaricum]|uniref:Uncharacterized protein n=1 Tax=Candidatus Magnetobacterium bavaricum TaxID=29290 RepID=A0A0F3GUU6_9BACT|nr:hypothetical protein MBAV_002122 [Candidatus Magnetobacterium bavaricum]